MRKYEVTSDQQLKVMTGHRDSFLKGIERLLSKSQELSLSEKLRIEAYEAMIETLEYEMNIYKKTTNEI